MSNLTTIPFKNAPITFEINGQVMVSLTDMARPYGKKVSHFLSLPTTKDFIQELESQASNTEYEGGLSALIQPVVITRKGKGNQGTWAHRYVAIKFAAWLDVRFEVWMIETIDRLMKGGMADHKQYFDLLQRLQTAKAKAHDLKDDLSDTTEFQAYQQQREVIKALEAEIKEYESRILQRQLSLFGQLPEKAN